MSGGSICDRRRGLFGVCPRVRAAGPSAQSGRWSPGRRQVGLWLGVVRLGGNAARSVALKRIRRPKEV